MKKLITILLLSITVSSYSQINTIKVQGVDTAAMLDPYKDDYPRQAFSLTTIGSSGASTYNPSTGVFNIPNYAGGAASSFWDSVTNIGINYGYGRVGVNNVNPVYKFDVTGNINVVGDSAYRIGGYSAIRARVTDDSYFIGNSGGTGTTGSGNQNTGLGSEALFSITSAQHSTAIGRSALYGVTTGTGNVALGSLALGSIQTSSYNIGVGLSAGEDYNNSAAKNLAGSRSIFIGAFTRAFADAQTNQIVIGDTAWGHGNNSITFGNNNIANTWLKGQINLRGYGSGTYTGTATRTLQVDAGGNVIEGSTASGIQASDTVAMLAGYQTAINTNTVNIATNTSNIALKLDKSGGTMTGHLLATDNAVDLGASGATRFRSAFLGTSLMVPAINGGPNANDDITIQGTTSATRTTSYVLLQPTAGNVGIGTISAPTELLSLRTDQNSNTALSITNATSGSAAQSSLYLVTNGGASQYASFAVTSAGFTPSGLTLANQYQSITAPGLTNGILVGTTANAPIVFSTNGITTERLRITGGGNIGIGTTSPTALLHIKAGTATASTAPEKNTAGTNLTTPEAGAREYDGTEYYQTNSTAVRGTFIIARLNSSSAGTLTLATTYTNYVFTGTTTAWTLPAVSGTTNHVFYIKNRGSGAITLGTAAAANELYTTAAVNTLTVNAGEGYALISDGTYFNILSKY